LKLYQCKTNCDDNEVSAAISSLAVANTPSPIHPSRVCFPAAPNVDLPQVCFPAAPNVDLPRLDEKVVEYFQHLSIVTYDLANQLSCTRVFFTFF
jgi:hypothetical protein